MEQLILVDRNDNPIGTCEKLEAHQKALLHRAFSILLFNEKGEMLLQKRFSGKYHSGGLWTNACCGHPRPGEETQSAATRRMMEELGMTCPLNESFSFYYKVPFDNGLTEHEFVHVYRGFYDGSFNPNPEEVEDLNWVALEDLKQDIERNPHHYTTWFRLYCEEQWGELIRMSNP
jgi:isopentenyl-diphosphate delta-isomerase